MRGRVSERVGAPDSDRDTTYTGRHTHTQHTQHTQHTHTQHTHKTHTQIRERDTVVFLSEERYMSDETHTEQLGLTVTKTYDYCDMPQETIK